MKLSTAPLSCLQYLSVQHGELKQAAICRTDGILGAGTEERTLASLFNDYISGYSPLSAEVGDAYYLPTSKVISEFISLGRSLSE